MRFLASLVLLAFSLALPLSAEPGQSFEHRGVAKDAERYEAYLSTTWKAGNRRSGELKAAAEKALPADPRAASRNYAAAVVADGRNADAWMGLARSLLAIKPDPNNGSERYDLPVNASAAAYIAYQRAGSDPVKAAALRVLGEALQRRSYWRPAIDAYKSSLALADDAPTRQVYEKLRTEHGFRMVDYKTDSEAASPRVCLQFSERLSRTQSDFSKFVSVDGKDPQGVTPEDKQLCIDGLAHGQRYEIQLRAGLPSDVGEALEKAAEVGVYVPDREAFVRFTGKSYVLPSRGQQGIPVVSVNTQRIAIEVYRVGDRNLSSVLANEFQRQISTYDADNIKDRTGERVYVGEMDVTPKLNEEVTTAFPVSEAIGQLKPGAYAMIARPASGKKKYGDLATQWFVVSDLGLTAFTGDDGLHAFVRSLASTDAIPAAEVKLVAKNNEVLAKLQTDANGYVRFDRGLVRGEGGAQPAILVAEKGAGEYAFLDLTTTAFDLSDRGVKGREKPGPLDGYIFAERGIYRPGEDVYLTSLVRDAQGKAATLPVTIIVTRPDGVEYRRFALNDMGLGGRAATLSLSGSAQTGTWRAKLHADPKAEPIAQTAFLVEDFVPERLEMKLTPADGALKPEQPFKVTLDGRYLYGPPAANLAVEGDIVVKASSRDVEGFPGYKFGMADEKFSTVRKPLDGLPSTNADGKAELPIQLPALTKTARPLEADLLIRLREAGGRTIERTVNVPVDLAQPRVGIKPAFDKLGEGETANFDAIVLDEGNKRVAAKALHWELVRLDTTWQWYSHSGNWTWEAQTITRKIASGTVDAAADAPARIAARVQYGRYRLDVSSADADGPAASYKFSTGWYSASEEDNADTPETLDVALDKASYNAGDTAKLRIATKLGGKALIAVLGNGLLATQTVEVPKGGGEVPVAVGNDWGPGAYVTALLYRPMDEGAKRMPSRAIGIKWLGLDQSPRTLKVALDLPEKVKSGDGLRVPVKVAGLGAGEEARVTVAAVDLGIINLTRYPTPAPEGWFNAQRMLGVEIRDFYGRLIDGMNAERGKLRSGGDGPNGGGMSMEGSPPVEATVSLYSGIVSVGADGTAKVDFKLPDFNGTVRVMAVAWSKDKTGHGSRDVIVRDAVALTVSGPRFLTLGDEARIDLSVHNVDGAPGTYAIDIEQDLTKPGAAGLTKNPVAQRALVLKALERQADQVTVKPGEVGRAEYDVSVRGPGDIWVKRHLSFDVKPPANDVRRTTVSSLAANGGKLTLSPDLVHDMITSRTRITMSVGPAALLDVPGVLAALDRYPYGCAEQTVSRAMPLVYANAIASQIGLGVDKAIRERVQGAIERVYEMQDSSGAFGVWGPSNADMWLTSYVADFLTRAKEQGYSIRPQAFSQVIDRLANYVSYAQDFERGGETRAYALYVLARNGRAPIGELRYYADQKLENFSTPLAKAQLGAALSMMGDKERAEKSFKEALDGFDVAGKDVTRVDFGSNLRDGAAIVTLAAETSTARTETPKLVGVVAKAFQSRRYTSTQEQAWMVLAANALADQAKQVKLSVNGMSVPGSINRSLSAEELKGGNLVVSNDGDVPTDAVISVIGSALTPEPPVSKGFRVERTYYTLDGKKVDLASATGGNATLKQNDRLVVVVKVDAKESGGRVLLVDRLPAGLEIENPRLVDGGDIKSLDWLKSAQKPEHTEFRDDRFVAAFNLSSTGSKTTGGEGEEDEAAEMKDDTPAASTATVAYIVRAVTPGSFVHPAATVEDMYRPERYARTAAGRLAVTAK